MTEVGPAVAYCSRFFTFLIRVHFRLIHGVAVFLLLITFFIRVHFGLICGVVVFFIKYIFDKGTFSINTW